MKKNELLTTTVWNEYQKGVEHNNQVGLYEKSRRNYNFYHGKQWENCKIKGIQPITLNIIKSIVKYKLGVVKTKTYQIFFNSDTYQNQEERQKLQSICDMLNRYANRIWDKNKVNKVVRNCIKDACIDSEGIIYFYADSDENSNNILCEQVNKTNIYYGNENDDDIQNQPYIIISFRKTVDEVKREAEKNKISQQEIDLIVEDQDIHEQSNDELRTNEIVPMCLVLLKLFRGVDGKIWAKKCTKTATIMKDTCLNITCYPIAHLLWERVKDSARGIGEVEQLIANQIEINKTATRRALVIKYIAFPKLVVNTKYISNSDDLKKIGGIIEVNEFSADDVNKVVNYLKPASISADAYNLQKELQEETQNLAGASDTATGNVDPTQASGKSILAVQEASQQPINEQVESYKEFIEDIARIWFEMLKANSVNGIMLTSEKKDYLNNTTIDEQYKLSYEELQKYDFEIRIDITPKSPFDKYMLEQSLENLLNGKYITFEEFVNSLPDDTAMPKARLKEILKEREEKEQIFNQIEKAGNALNSAVQQVMQQQQLNNVEQTGVSPEQTQLVDNQNT